MAVAVVAIALLAAGRADAGRAKTEKAEQVREYLDKATAAFALNHFADAADNYEKAFSLKPDAAVLYNAAQAHRLAGNKERALELYQSYLRLYGGDRRAEVEGHIESLKQAIEKDRAVATSPPTTPAPVGAGAGATTTTQQPAAAPTAVAAPSPPVAVAESPPPPYPQAPPAPRPMQPAPVLITQAAPAADGGSVFGKPWFWIVVGAVVAGAVVTTLLLSRRDPSDPVSTLDPVNGN